MSFPSTKQGSTSGAPVIGHRAPAHPPSDMSISESFTTIWNVFMSVRDAYAESRGSGVPKRDVTFEKIVEFMLQNRRANSEVVGLLERFLGSSHTSYSDEEVTAYLCTSVQGTTQYFRQVYRYVALFDKQDGSKDRRVRDFYEWTIDGRRGGGTGMVQRVFNNDIFKRYFRGAATGKGRGRFRTVPATRFQQLLYLSVVKHIEIERTGRERKRRLGHGKKVKAVKYVESFTMSNRMHGQRMAYGVQHVCRAWDAFAVVLGFRDCEQMMLPYLLINRDTFKLSDIHSRTIGYSPKTAAYKLGQEMKPTVSEDNVVPWAIAFSDDVDRNMRILAREFVSDLRRIVLDKKMYELSETEQWPVLSTFTRSGTNPPVRFDSLSEDIVKSVKEACAKHNVQPSKAWSRPTDVHSKPSAAPGTKSHTKSVQAVGKQLRESSNGSGQTDGSGSSSDDVIATPTAPAAAEIQATVDVSVNILPPHGTLGPVTAKAMKILESVMDKNFAFYCVESEELVEVHESVPGGTISPRGRVQLSISDGPYQIRDTEYDRISHQKMVSFADHNSDCLRPGGHLFVFCSGFQFPIWYKILTDCQYVDADGRMKKSFTVDKTSLLCLRHRSNPMAFPGRNNISLFPAGEQVVHAVRNGIPYAEQKTMVNYRKFNHVASRYPGHVGVIDQVPHHAPGERLYWKVRDGQRFVNRQIRPEQKSRQLMKELIARFSQPGDLVMDFFSGTFTTALACMELVPHRKFIGGEKYRNCFIHAKHNGIVHMGKLIADNSLKVGDLECDERIGTNAVVQAALHVATVFRKRSRGMQWTAPKDFPQYQRFPFHIMAFLSTLWGDMDLIGKYRTKALHLWPQSTQAKLNELEPELLRGVDASSYWCVVAKSSVKHPSSGLGVFSARNFAEGEAVCHFYGTIVYHDISQRPQQHVTYGEGLMGATVSRFNKFSMEVVGSGIGFETLPTYNGGTKTARIWIVPAPFCMAGYINDPRYLDGDEEKDLAEDEPNIRRKANVQIRPVSSTLSQQRIMEYTLLSARAIRDIKEGEELFLRYGNDNVFRSTA